ncbi:MAG TPA: hypothetical protein VKP10_18000 [Gemmatimonadales bacterium]|nr:hypothetical protein [Gemmatimonadales bacterium]
MNTGLWSCLALLAGSALLAARRAPPSQRCDEPHYRWSAKTDTSLFAGRTATVTTVTEILTRWTTPALGRRDGCAPRAGRERNFFELSGWIRRIEKVKDDGDWHIELTAGPTSPTDSCIVAEIPLGSLGAVFGRARTQLDALLAGRRLDKDGDLKPPLAVRIRGAPFFDGQHRRTTRKRDETDGGHGRCNSSLRALWEIHPVYAVSAP